MRPPLDPRIAAACAALGAAGAACTLALGPRAASAKQTAPPPSFAALRQLRWVTGDSPVITRALKRQVRPNPMRAAVAGKIRRMIAAGDAIAHRPYIYGGGHGSFDAAGYDCSGSVSYVLHAGGLLSTPEDSNSLEGFGLPGPGKRVTIYANSAHAWMTIDGRRYDTIAFQETGTRWSSTITSSSGYVVRHPAGL